MAGLERLTLSNLAWEGDKDEDGFFVFLENFGSVAIASSTIATHGHHLETMLDSKLRQARLSKGTIPSYILDDPYFAVAQVTGAEPDGGDGAQAEDATSDAGSASGGSGAT